ncbi:hypothetical protein StoSoilB20_32910 [Arthrobacter sp. StoSoilB20]|nr:hypothetical protein StoSoilB20_32910 [Arthrobacter sp. StoSoilB20]
MRIFQIGDPFPSEMLSVRDDCSDSSFGRGARILCSLGREHDGQHVAADALARPELSATGAVGELVDFGEEATPMTLTVVGTWPAV